VVVRHAEHMRTLWYMPDIVHIKNQAVSVGIVMVNTSVYTALSNETLVAVSVVERDSV